MDQIRKQVDRARRRLWLELLLGRVVKCWFVALAAAVIAIAVPKLIAIENLPAQWAELWLGGAVGAGLLVALGWTLVRGRSELEAAIEIDRRFDLKERVASSLSLPPEAADTPAGRALVADALRAVRQLEIDERFKIRVGRSAWLPIGPAVLAVVLMAFFGNKQAQSSVGPVPTINAQNLDNALQALRKKQAELRKEAAKRGLAEAEAISQVERELERLAAAKESDPKKTLVKLNDLARQLEERRERLGGSNELKRQLAGMKDIGDGPAEKMAEAMKSGDWKKAQQELQKLQEQLKAGKLDEATKKQLAAQLEQMQQKLAESTAQRQQAIDDLKKQIEEQKSQGKVAEAGELQQKLDKMLKSQQQSKKLEQLAQKMAEAQQNLQRGDQQAASQAMQEMMQQMEQMQQEMQEGEMLDMAMAQLENAKDAMTCESCGGEGCEECQGGGGDMMSDRPGRGGDGMGAARGGFGDRPEERTDTAFRDSQVKQKPGRGAAVITGEADGPTIRGEVREAVKEEMESQGSEPADPLVIEQLPRTQRENAEDYFLRLKDGE